MNDNWYVYDNNNLIEIKIELNSSDFKSRIKKSLFYNLLINIIVFTFLYVITKGKYDNATILTGNLSLFLLLFCLFSILLSILISFFLNKYKLIKLQANIYGITMKYYIWNNMVDFYSPWNEIRIKKRNTKIWRISDYTLIFKNNDRILLKIYSDIDKEFTSKNIDQLMKNFKIIKDASR